MKYDQVLENYRSLSRRRKSRFIASGRLFGIFCLVGSRKYPGQFSDIKEEEHAAEYKRKGSSSIFLYDKRSWDISPEGTYSGKKFKIFVGDEIRDPVVIPAGKAKAYPSKLVMNIPIEYHSEFAQGDIWNAVREVAGIATRAMNPFITNSKITASAFGRQKSIFSREIGDLLVRKVKVFPTRFVNLKRPRAVHIDLAQTKDRAGIAIGHVSHLVHKKVGSAVEWRPNIIVDGILGIEAPANREISFQRIREMIYRVRDLGLPIKWVTIDTFQSTDTLQMLWEQGFVVGRLSLDTDTLPYETLKDTFNERRIQIPKHKICKKEVLQLEYDVQNGKIDHPPKGSKDCSDALGGMVRTLHLVSETYVAFEKSIPRSLQTEAKKQKRYDENNPMV